MEPLVTRLPRRPAPLLPIFFVFGLTVAAYVVLNDRVQDDPSLEPTGDVIVVERNRGQGATVVESIVVEENTEVFDDTISNTLEPISLPPPLLSVSLTAVSYIEIIDSCGPHFEGVCVNARREPSTSSPALLKLRTGVVLRTDGIVEADGIRWHRVIFDEWIRYPERLKKELYVAESYGVEKKLEPPAHLSTTTPPTTKRILVDRSDQKLTAYEADGSVFMEQIISTGKDSTPTPRGTFTIFKKMPTRYMQGPLPGISNDFYDLPGVPWNLYFTEQGGALHGAYWHDKFGQQWSHGCVNLPPDKAKQLYLWADLGTAVTIRD